MNQYTIRQGTHRAVPVRPALYLKQSFAWDVQFDESAKYIVPADYQLDIQKLIGIGYLFGDNSARFGWRFNPLYQSAVELMAYTHDHGVVTKSDTEVRIGILPFRQVGRLTLKVLKDEYRFGFMGHVDRPLVKTHNQKLSFKMGPYFECGEPGNLIKAPHDIRILIRAV